MIDTLDLVWITGYNYFIWITGYNFFDRYKYEMVLPNSYICVAISNPKTMEPIFFIIEEKAAHTMLTDD